jgi:hypothetical protein
MNYEDSVEKHPDMYLPAGAGAIPDDVRQAQLAVSAYDAQLILGVDKHDNTWCVLWEKGPEGRPYPVLNLGKELPSYEAIQKRLYEADVVRNGGAQVAAVTARQDKLRADARAEAHEAATETAEHLEHMFHKADMTEYKRVFMPGIALPGRDF